MKMGQKMAPIRRLMTAALLKPRLPNRHRPSAARYPPSDDGGPIEAAAGYLAFPWQNAPIRRLMTAALLKLRELDADYELDLPLSAV